MIRTLSLAAVLATALTLSAMGEDAKTTINPGTAPTTVVGDQVPQMKGDGAAASQPVAKSNPAATAPPNVAPQNVTISLSEQEGKSWITRPVYSSDGKNIGKVADFQRNADNAIIGMHADIGGFWGLGRTQVTLTTSQFKLQGDRVLIDLTAAAAKELPKAHT